MTGRDAASSGGYPRVHLVDRMSETKKVVELVIDLHKNQKVTLADISILYPYRHRQYSPYRYYIEMWIDDALRQKQIKHSLVTFSEENPTFYDYTLRRGVTLSTMDSIKGLDFSAVIVCGLFGFNNPHDKATDKILLNMKKVYTAMTRAMRCLDILIPDDRRDVISQFIFNIQNHRS